MKDNSIKVNIFSHSKFPRGQANSVNVIRMAEAIFNLGYDVHLHCYRSSFISKNKVWDQTIHRFGIDIGIKKTFIYWPFNFALDPLLGIVFLLKFLFKVKSKNIILTRSKYVALISGLFRYNTIYESHAVPVTLFSRLIESIIFNNANVFLVFISSGLLNQYIKIGFQFESYLIAPSGGRSQIESKIANGLFHGPCRNIGYIGSLYPGRGFDIIFQLAKNLPNRNFHVIGDFRPLQNNIEKLPNNLHLYGEVTPMQAEKLPMFFDVLLMPYQSKVFLENNLNTVNWMSPMKLFEYMFCFKPIISSDISVLKEILTHNKNCLLVEPDNLQEWMAAIDKLDNPELRRKISYSAYKDAQKKFSWEKRAKIMLEKLNQFVTN